MRTELPDDIETELDVEAIRSTLREHPVRFAILFGSHATGEAHPSSDIDIAVELSTHRPSDPGFNDIFLGLSADLSETLQTDDVDLVDLHSVSPELAESIFTKGVLLLGDKEAVASRSGELVSNTHESRSPRERLDTAISRIDAHFDDDESPVPASGESGPD